MISPRPKILHILNGFGLKDGIYILRGKSMLSATFAITFAPNIFSE